MCNKSQISQYCDDHDKIGLLKSSVVQLQEKLLEKQTDHISEIHNAVQSTVTSTVEKEIKCYSDTVKKNQS